MDTRSRLLTVRAQRVGGRLDAHDMQAVGIQTEGV